jgi:4-hydroxybenzoate polyprenyltransferase
MSATDELRPADAAPSTWVDRYAPAWVGPYLRLARADRPIGVWLLLWPCWWSMMLAASQTPLHFLSVVYLLWLMLLFAIGAAVMRGAGCTYNDIVDGDIDAKVARTAGRPIASGQVTVAGAIGFLALQLLIGLGVLLMLNWYSVVLGALSLLPIAIYPFMKRITDWPQAFLGLTFNWGALLGWTAVTGELAVAPVLLYLGCILWTLGYDTIYAHQDKEDDALIGVRSTARLFGARTKWWLAGFYTGAWMSFFAAGLLVQLGVGYFVGLGLVAAHLAMQIITLNIDDGTNCLRIFKSNRDLGLIMVGAILAGIITG